MSLRLRTVQDKNTVGALSAKATSRGVTLYLFGRARAPNVGKKRGQIRTEIRCNQDFYGTLSTFRPFATPPPLADLEKLHLCKLIVLQRRRASIRLPRLTVDDFNHTVTR